MAAAAAVVVVEEEEIVVVVMFESLPTNRLQLSMDQGGWSLAIHVSTQVYMYAHTYTQVGVAINYLLVITTTTGPL